MKERLKSFIHADKNTSAQDGEGKERGKTHIWITEQGMKGGKRNKFLARTVRTGQHTFEQTEAKLAKIATWGYAEFTGSF